MEDEHLRDREAVQLNEKNSWMTWAGHLVLREEGGLPKRANAGNSEAAGKGADHN